MSSDINSIFSFPGTGMDTDSDLVTIESGNSRYRRNIVVSDDGNHNVLTNSLGNTLKTNSSLPATGANKTVGLVEDKEVDAIIFFNYNSGGNHGIYIYYSATDTFDTLFIASWLDFQSDRFIDAEIIGNQDDRYLIFTDGYNPIRSVNIESVLANPFTTGDEASQFYKRPFTGNISAVYSSYSSYDGNDLKGKSFQFSIRLKYYDKAYSTISPFSVIPIPDYESIPNGRLTDEEGNNVINVSISMNHDIDSVTSYQLLYRIIDIGSGSAGSWHIYNNVDYTASGAQATIPFLNDTSIGVISDTEAARPYDFVPDKANHVGVIDANRAIFDVAEEGYDNIDYSDSDKWDVSLTPTETAISASDNGINYSETNTVGESGSGFNTTETFSVITDIVSDDFFYIVQASETDTTGPTFDNKYFYIESSYNQTSSDTIDDIITFINATGHPVTADKNGNDLRLTITASTPTTILVTVELIIIEKTPTFRSLKTQAKYKFGLRYGYGGKIGSVQFTDDLIKETISFKDLTATDTLFTTGMQLSINHEPPAGATDFQVVSFGSNVSYFEEYLVFYNTADSTDNAAEYTLYSDGGNTVIKRDDIVNRFKKAYSSGSETIGTESVNYGIDYGFDINEGDIVRFVGHSKTVSGINDYDFTLFTESLDFRVDSVSSTEIRIGYSAMTTIENLLSAVTFNGALLIQVIQLKDTFSSLGNEFSQVYPITGGYHEGNTQDQTISLPALIDITDDFGDVWKSKQVFMNQYNSDDYGFTTYTEFSFGWMEKPRISLYYDSYPESQGRVNAVNEFSEQKGYNKIRWGGKFIDDAGVNYMTRFEFDDEKFLDDRNGSITVINQVGDTLKVYQERKTNSLYLKTTSSDDPNGTSTFVFSDNVMSDPRQSVVDYGCTHFESYVRDVRNSFFFDLGNKTALIDTPGGIMSITDGVHKMHTYFSQKSAAIVLYGKEKVQVHGTYDDDLDLYVLSFVVPLAPTHDINDTVAFHIPSKRWITHFPLPASRPLEYYGRLTGKTMVSFVDAQLYLHNSNQTRNNFWGEQFDSEIWIHANEAPAANKTYNSIEINSTGQWSCPDDDSIEITKPSLMRSRLVAGKFKIQEGIFRSEFLRNALNKALAFVRHLLLNGPILRGREMTIKLKNTDTTEAQLETVIVKSTISK